MDPDHSGDFTYLKFVSLVRLLQFVGADKDRVQMSPKSSTCGRTALSMNLSPSAGFDRACSESLASALAARGTFLVILSSAPVIFVALAAVAVMVLVAVVAEDVVGASREGAARVPRGCRGVLRRRNAERFQGCARCLYRFLLCVVNKDGFY